MLRVGALVVSVVALVATSAGARAGDDPLSSPSLSDGGRQLAETARLVQAAPEYALDVTVDPRTGALAGQVEANLPAPIEGDELLFRVFAGLPELDTGIEISDVTVDGDPADSHLEDALLTVRRPGGFRAERVAVALRFTYRLPEIDPGKLGGIADLGESLDPADVGLLGRHRGGATLGHWFPVWLPATATTDADPEGFGDLGNFPAAVFTAEITIPDEFDAVTGGVRVDENEHEGGTRIVEEGVGLRDFAVFVGRNRVTEQSDAAGATVRVTAPRAARDDIADVAREAGAALTTFGDAFAPYPWSELDVVSVPLGSGVAGMEWPGMVWIEAGTFAGGIPGIGDLPAFDEIFEDLDELFDDLGVENFDDLELPDLGGGGVSSREFVIAHEVAHQWWHALVGNDSIAAPVIDEPLAQYSACLYAGQQYPDDGEATCSAQTDTQYQTMRLLGEEDAPADQPTDAFTSSLQYGGVVYGKAPGFYRALRDLVGADAVQAALRGFATTYAFGIAGPDELRAALRAAAPGREAEIDGLWQRWIEEAHGDEDIGTELFAGPSELPPLDRLDALLQLLEGLTTGR